MRNAGSLRSRPLAVYTWIPCTGTSEADADPPNTKGQWPVVIHFHAAKQLLLGQ